MTDLAAFRAEIDGIAVEDNPAIVKQKSRDFYWYSPVLKERLDHIVGDLVVSPRRHTPRVRHPRGAGNGAGS